MFHGAEVKSDIIEPARSNGVEFDRLTDKARVVKLWSACREAMKATKAAKDGVAGADSPLPKYAPDDIVKL